MAENPEVGMMGSFVLVMPMKGEVLYVMNIGDSSAVLVPRMEPNLQNKLGEVAK